MQPRELMIGNYVYPIQEKNGIKIPLSIPMRICSIDLFKVKAYNANNKLFRTDDSEIIEYDHVDISPIPMSTEILEKCKGFGEWWIWLLLSKPSTIEVKYLHQFQNLYFSLTGQELEVSL